MKTTGTLLDDDLRAAAECQLITTGRTTGRPREITIWFAAVADRVYVLSGGREQAHWLSNLQTHPIVRVRIERRTFEGRGRPVEGEPDDAVA